MRLPLALFAMIYSAAPADAAERFALKCLFTEGVITVPSKGVILSPTSETLAIAFAAIDLKEGKAQLVGESGAPDVMAIPGENGITFVEITQVGNVGITTIYRGSGGDTPLNATHSRHMGISGQPIISHFLGKCRRLD